MIHIRFTHVYNDIISLENLLQAWKEFVKGKRKRQDVQEFERNLMSNIIILHNDLISKNYKHSQYKSFNISDPKPRNIHKATVRDRLLHHAIYRILYSYFDKTFISDSFSCRFGKGTHEAINRFREFSYKVSRNHTRNVWVLKCDIKKFFASIDQKILIEIIKKYINDEDTIWLLTEIISSFYSAQVDRGLPLGNLTSQLLVNIYMNEFDQFMKHRLKIKYYIRYADDFIILSPDRDYLESIIQEIQNFLDNKLHLHLHPNKISIRTISSGVDYLGWILFPDHRVIRATTRKRILKRLNMIDRNEQSTQSYLGHLRHGNSYKIRKLLQL